MSTVDLQSLKALIDSDPSNSSKTDEEIVGWCNGLTQRGDVEASDIIGVILIYDTAGPLQRAAADALTASDAVHDAAFLLEDRERLLAYGDPAVYAKLQSILPALVSEGILLQQTADIILSLGENKLSRAAVSGLGRVRVQHVIDARSL